jgi:hypothetical protein
MTDNLPPAAGSLEAEQQREREVQKLYGVYCSVLRGIELLQGARKWCPECRRWVPAPHTCPDFFAATPELSVIK